MPPEMQNEKYIM